jgi:hypothetical protein
MARGKGRKKLTDETRRKQDVKMTRGGRISGGNFFQRGANSEGESEFLLKAVGTPIIWV